MESKGNCIVVDNENTTLMVDVGISRKKTEEGLEFFNKTADDVDGILITHEHSDHIKGLGVFLRKYQKPVYATEKTIDYILNESSIGQVDTDLFNVISPMKDLVIGDMQIMPMKISHDAADPVCYKFMSNTSGDNKVCAVVTDLGESSEPLINNLQDLDAILLEANHDINSYRQGRIPII